MSGPSEIWIDERVVRTMKTEPDENAAGLGAGQLRFISAERVAELMHDQGTEFFIQILLDDRTHELIGLTNYGRIFARNNDSDSWLEIAGPDREDLVP